MKCRFCGTNLPDDARFCSGCGREVEREDVSANEKNNNETEDAYYREIDDKEYEEIKKKKKEEERQREEAVKEEAERKLLEEKYAREEVERKRREEQRIMDESRRRYEEEQRRWKEFVKKQEESEEQKVYRGYDVGSGTAASESTKKGQKAKTQKKKKPSMPFLLYLFIVLAGGFALYKCGFPEMLIDSIHKSSSVSDSKKNTSSKGGKDKKDVDKKATDNTTSDKKTGDKKETEHMLEDTENSHMSVESCLSTDAYNTVISEDGSFSFGYPKYLFNHSEVNASGNSYSLTYKEGGEEKKAELAVYTEENEGNALENAKQLYDRFSSQVNEIYFKMQPTRTDSEGMARTLIGASVDSSETTGVYIIAANDGEKNYILKFTYPDPDMKDDYNAIDYVVDCVYRYCSFSGGTYCPRTYQQFLKDDMGKKK